jgi:KaiC/GvpD/RAD55 family RecA-like ATPase
MSDDFLEQLKEIKRIKTHILGLDENLGGGIPEGHIVLISGTAGTMKSSLAFNILYNEALNSKKIGLYLSLEQSFPSLLKQMIDMNYDLSMINLVTLADISKLNDRIAEITSSNKGTLVISDLGAIRKQVEELKVGPGGDWLNVIKNIVKKLKAKVGCDLFVLDSLSALYALSNFDTPRTQLFHLFEYLRDNELTSFLVSEMPLDESRYAQYEVEDYLSDGIIHVMLTKRYRKVTREISVPKMRATRSNLDIFTLEFKNDKFYALYGGKTPLV